MVKMEEANANSQLKQKMKGYGILLGYSLVGVAGLAYFAFKIIMIRQENLAKIKNKSKQPIMHTNMRNFTVGGLVSLVAYTYGISYLMQMVPKSEANFQLRDDESLPLKDQMSPTLQDHYIFKTMRIFRVSETLIQKAGIQFEQLAKKHPEEAQKQPKPSQNVNTEVFKSMWERLKWELKGKTPQA